MMMTSVGLHNAMIIIIPVRGYVCPDRVMSCGYVLLGLCHVVMSCWGYVMWLYNVVMSCWGYDMWFCHDVVIS